LKALNECLGDFALIKMPFTQGSLLMQNNQSWSLTYYLLAEFVAKMHLEKLHTIQPGR
jgi:hypothetical protein